MAEPDLQPALLPLAYRKATHNRSTERPAMFLIRTAFWLSIVILILPGDPNAPADSPRVNALEALLAARATVADISAFCARNPDVCATGGDVVDVMAGKVRYNAQRLYEYVTPHAPPADTLTGPDLDVPWRGDGAV